MPTPVLDISKDPAALAASAVEKFIMVAGVAIAQQGKFAVAFSGGSTPKAMFQLLASPTVASRVDWSSVEVYFVDERCVPPEHPDSNFGMANANLLSKVPLAPANVHRMKGEIDPNTAAIEYGKMLKARFGDGGVDLMFLGMGEDGHTASLFPHTPATKETHHRCVAQHVEHSTTGDSWRITLTAPFINRSTEIAVLVAGKDKAAIVKAVLMQPRDAEKYPVQLIEPASGHMSWMLDEAAASQLK